MNSISTVTCTPTEKYSERCPGTRLDELFELMYDPILHFIQSRVQDRTDAEDLTSQTFLQAVRWHDTSRSEAEVRSWLFQIARTVIGDHWRRFYRHGYTAELTDQVADVVPVVYGQDETRVRFQVASILRQLPVRYRRVLELRFLRGSSIEETAAAMSITVSNAKVLQHRALRKAASANPNGVGRLIAA